MNKLEDQFKIKEMTVRNRLVLPPLTTNYGSENGYITSEVLRFYKARSRQMGIVIVEAVAVSPEGRVALAVEITSAVRENLGPDYPIFFRLNVLENLEGGMTPDDAVAIGKLLTEAGVDVLDLSLAVQGTWKADEGRRIVITTSAYAKDETPGDVVDLAARVRIECGLPVIAVGRLGSKSVAQQALGAGADLVAIGRQMIRDPDTAEKILSGRDDQILECEACQTCFASLGKGKPIQCKQNKNLPD